MKSLENTKCKPPNRTETPKRWFVLSFLYYGMLSVLSQIPGSTLNELEFRLWDKGVHFGAYGLLGVFLFLGVKQIQRRFFKKNAVLITVGIVALAGAFDEVHQMFVIGRNASIGDFIADTLGGAAGAISAGWIYPLAVSNHFKNSKAKIT